MTAIPTWRRGWPFAAVAAIQIGLLAWAIVDRALILAPGQEVELAVAPVDPRDPILGEYIRLNYAISRLDRSDLPADATEDWPKLEPRWANDRVEVWLRLEPRSDGAARIMSVHSHPPPAAPGTVVLAGRTSSFPCGWNRVTKSTDCSILQVTFGIERYYVPEGEGKKLEQPWRAQRMSVVAAVAPDGRASIKRLLVDRKPVHDEPLF